MNQAAATYSHKFYSLLQQLRKTAHRFPFAILALLGAYLLSFYIDSNPIGIKTQYWSFFTTTLFVFGLNFQLFYEHNLNTYSRSSFLIATPILAVVLHFYLINLEDKTYINYITFSSANYLLLFVVPFLSRKDNDKISYYWYELIIALRDTLIACLAFAIGFSAFFGSIQLLFGKDVIPPKIYGEIMRFTVLVLAPLFYISCIPRKEEISQVQTCQAPRAIKLTLTWIMIPFCFLFLSVLYAYFFKLAFFGGNTKIVLVSVAIVFSLYSIFIYLLSYPLTTEDNKPARLIQNYVFYLLIIPTIILIWRFGVRIHEHGWTILRFYAALLILWLVFNIGYHVYCRKKGYHDIRMPLLSAAVILLITSLSPWVPAKHLSTSRFEGSFFGNPAHQTTQTELKERSYAFTSNSRTVETKGYDYFLPYLYWGNHNTPATVPINDQDHIEFKNDKTDFILTLPSGKIINIPFKILLLEAIKKGNYDLPEDSKSYHPIKTDRPLIVDYENKDVSIRFVIGNITIYKKIEDTDFSISGGSFGMLLTEK